MSYKYWRRVYKNAQDALKYDNKKTNPIDISWTWQLSFGDDDCWLPTSFWPDLWGLEQKPSIYRREDGTFEPVVNLQSQFNSKESFKMNKLEKVHPLVEMAKYVRGTEKGHYYLITHELPNAIIGFRPLAVNFAPIGTDPEDAAGSIRVRIVPTTTFTARQITLLERLTGATKKSYVGDDRAHWSVVTDSPAEVIADAVLALS